MPVVDELEVVEVQHEHGGVAALAFGAAQRTVGSVCHAAALSRPVLLSMLASSSSWRTRTVRCRTIRGGSTSTAYAGPTAAIAPAASAPIESVANSSTASSPRQSICRNVAEVAVRSAQHDHRDDQDHVDRGVGEQGEQDDAETGHTVEKRARGHQGGDGGGRLDGEHHGGRAEQDPVERHVRAPPDPRVQVRVDRDGHSAREHARQQRGRGERPHRAEVDVRALVVGLLAHSFDAERGLGAEDAGRRQHPEHDRPAGSGGRLHRRAGKRRAGRPRVSRRGGRWPAPGSEATRQASGWPRSGHAVAARIPRNPFTHGRRPIGCPPSGRIVAG